MSYTNQSQTPLFDAMVSLAKSRKVSFHTPGHKSGKGISTRFKKFVGPKIFSIDLTTLDEVDSLQKPKGVIKEAQALAAKSYSADHSFFLLNGTTGGNHAMILATCQPGDEVLIARNAHKSILSGLIFSGANPTFFSPEMDQDHLLPLNISVDAAKAAIDTHPKARVLVLTSPNYYGISAKLEEIITYAHQQSLIVLVDEAHGPHFHFHKNLPASAMTSGADLAVQSTHKIIGGMTQSSMLHVKLGRINFARLSSVLRMVQSTSPSYILMASLDLARMQMATAGEKLLEKVIRLAEDTRRSINQIPGLFCFDQKTINRHYLQNPFDFDVTKLTIQVRGLGLSGYQVSHLLNNDHQIQIEMADPMNILVIVSIGDRQDDLDRLVFALRKISKQFQGRRKTGPDFNPVALPPYGRATAMGPREAFFKTQEYLPIAKTEGRVSSQIVTIYPPGIPILVPGEVITQEIISYFEKIAPCGASIDGLDATNRMGVVCRE